MKNLIRLCLLLSILVSCDSDSAKKDLPVSQKKDSVVTIEKPLAKDTLKIDKTYIGMTLENLKLAYNTADIREDFVRNYGIDSEAKGLLVVQDQVPLLFVWTMDGENKIAGIEVLSGKINVDGTIHVGMTAGECLALFKDAKLAIDALDGDIEFINVKEKNYRLEFLTAESTRIGKYKDTEAGEPEFVKLNRPDAKVSRIGFYRNY